jgi:hypothetical protein
VQPVTDYLGYHICPLNDVDGDGRNDFVLDDGLGWMWLVSGRTGTVLKQEHAFMDPVVLITPLYGDVDGDGVFDFALERSAQGLSYAVEIRSGRTLEVLRTISAGTTGPYLMGPTIAGLGDWNGDGIADIALIGVKEMQGAITIFSGNDGSAVGTVAEDSRWQGVHTTPWSPWCIMTGPSSANGWRRSLAVRSDHHTSIYGTRGDKELWSCPFPEQLISYVIPDIGFVGDLDGDGIPEVVRLAESPAHIKDPHEPYCYATYLLRGRDGTQLSELVTPDIGIIDGIATDWIGDVDGDGVDDFLVAFQAIPFSQAIVYSGKDFSVIRRHKEEWDNCWEESCRFGITVVALGRIDDDEVGDYAIGSSGGPDHLNPGCVSVYSGATGERLYVLWRKDLVK